ncbi:hypothetical protein GKC29_25000 [Micromonospora sp. WMMC415]|uniref:hypothetical protein n=1 Tax=Micromonospora sp. WMMC415 TaxID=2675222 RepID=UPI0012B484D8|nr:hypothetical protein [Micromonospora sp. WMMC415]QGN49765.1 hypothetical protein GKC29_25000 [Micromonospora sp. WMMC415]
MSKKPRPQPLQWSKSRRSMTPQWRIVTVIAAGRRRWIALGSAVAVVAGLTTWALWPDPPRQREYLDATACLLTGESGVTAEPAATIWTAMQDTSAVSRVRAQYLPVNGPQTTANATVYLNTLASRRCGAVIAVGQAQVDATADVAGKHPEVRFMIVGTNTNIPGVQALDPASPDTVRAQLNELLKTLANNAA